MTRRAAWDRAALYGICPVLDSGTEEFRTAGDVSVIIVPKALVSLIHRR